MSELEDLVARLVAAHPLIAAIRKDEAERALHASDPTWREPRPEPTAPSPPDLAAALVRERERAALREAGLAAGIVPRALRDFEARCALDLPRTPSSDPTAAHASMAEFVGILRRDAPFLFVTARPRGNGHAEAEDSWMIE